MYDPLTNGMAPRAASWCEVQDLWNGGGIYRKASTIPLPQTSKLCGSLLWFACRLKKFTYIRTKFVRNSYEFHVNECV